MTSARTSFRGRTRQPADLLPPSTSLADILERVPERVLDKGIVIAGGVCMNLLQCLQ